jgi:hypothetical protein
LINFHNINIVLKIYGEIEECVMNKWDKICLGVTGAALAVAAAGFLRDPKTCYIDGDGGLYTVGDKTGKERSLNNAWRLAKDGFGQEACIGPMANGSPTDTIKFGGQRERRTPTI